MRKIAITLSALIGATIAFALPGFADTTYFRDGVNVTGTLVAFDHGCGSFQFFDLDASAANMLKSSGACAAGWTAGNSEDREERERLEALEAEAEAEAAAAAAAEAEDAEIESI
jgi:hypothetical protein